MASLIGVLLGLPLATFGFLVMRNPMRLAVLSRGQEGYYQRMVLDSMKRIQLRVVGVLVCLFGAGILTDLLGSGLKVSLLSTVSEGLWVLMGCIFFVAFGFGLILAIRQLIKGEPFDWWRMWKVSAELGPIDVVPAVTPKMRKEANIFTAALLFFVAVAAVGAAFGYFM